MEFVLAIPIVLLLFSGIVEFGRHYHTRLTLRHAISEAARFAVTGQTLVDSTGTPMTRAQSIVQTVQRSAADLNVDVSQLVITPPDGGGPGEVVTIQATYRFDFVLWPVKRLVNGGHIDFTASTTVMNEPF